MTNDAPLHEVKRQCQEWRDAKKLNVAFVSIHWHRNEKTHEIEVYANFGVAPDQYTIILYPIGVRKSGYWNKTQTRKEMTAAKRELLAKMSIEGYTKQNLTQDIEIKSLEYF